MRTRLTPLVGLVAAAVLAVALGTPAKAEEKFEGTILMPAPVASEAEYADMACASPDTGGELNGITYAWVDLKADYKKFEFDGPADLFREPDPTGAVGGPFGDHDLDWYLFDAKCKDVTTHSNVGESKVKAEARRPARYVMVIYWTGIHPEIPYSIIAKN